ncbi:hypothetical protein FHX80_12504 [Streptomyces brevispora]|uniref:Uncharacterized protein n=1 Tax=Streptomyces brevispora TaxID=887462 RepID=A0A561TYL1_9ACTN|nr:hypothetical protein FHX80_12504 [Streptomyces brevispora]
MKVAYIDQYKNLFGVQPICDVLAETDAPIAPSTYYAAHNGYAGASKSRSPQRPLCASRTSSLQRLESGGTRPSPLEAEHVTWSGKSVALVPCWAEGNLLLRRRLVASEASLLMA